MIFLPQDQVFYGVTDGYSGPGFYKSCHASVMDVDLDCQVKGLWFASRQRQECNGSGFLKPPYIYMPMPFLMTLLVTTCMPALFTCGMHGSCDSCDSCVYTRYSVLYEACLFLFSAQL